MIVESSVEDCTTTCSIKSRSTSKAYRPVIPIHVLLRSLILLGFAFQLYDFYSSIMHFQYHCHFHFCLDCDWHETIAFIKLLSNPKWMNEIWPSKTKMKKKTERMSSAKVGKSKLIYNGLWVVQTYNLLPQLGLACLFDLHHCKVLHVSDSISTFLLCFLCFSSFGSCGFLCFSII